MQDHLNAKFIFFYKNIKRGIIVKGREGKLRREDDGKEREKRLW